MAAFRWGRGRAKGDQTARRRRDTRETDEKAGAAIDLCKGNRYTAPRIGQPMPLPDHLIRPATGRPHRLEA